MDGSSSATDCLACLCGVLTSLLASSCAERQAATALVRREASWAKGAESAAERIP